MLTEFTRDRYKALELLAEHIRYPSKDLLLSSILHDVNEDDLKWVTGKIHYYLLRLLEEANYEPSEDELILELDKFV
tara:strand:- start:28 stop:258 length:231 start_codon:yes stop_codon:yes gene_type:complete